VGKGGPDLHWVRIRLIRRAHAPIIVVRVGTAERTPRQSADVSAAFAHPTNLRPVRNTC